MQDSCKLIDLSPIQIQTYAMIKMPTLEAVTDKYSPGFPISRRDTLYLLGGGLLLAACGSKQYEGRIQGDLEQKIETKGQYTMSIKLSNVPQGAKELNLKPSDKIIVTLPKSKVTNPYGERLRQCPEVRVTGSNECYVDLKIAGMKGQGPNEMYSGVDVYNVEVKAPTDGAKGKVSDFLKGAKEKASELFQRAKEKAEEYSKEKAQELLKGGKKE